jgi:hypothetical protein
MAVIILSSINYYIQQIAIYYGIPIFILSVIGALLNILVFLSSKTFRHKSCVFYLTVMSILDLGRLLTSTLSNILSWGFGIDWTISSLFYCKIKVFIFSTCSLSSITCLCLAIIDQYFTNCSHSRWQKWCNIKLAHRLTAIFLSIWILHGIPYFIFYDHIISPSTNQTICQITNYKFIQYHTYGYFLILTNLLPLIAVIFGLMAYHNARRLIHRKIPVVRRELDKQLTKMILVQILIYFCTILPYSIQSMFALMIKNNESNFRTKMKLASIITLHFSILSYAVCFFLLIIFYKLFFFVFF